MGWCSWGLPGGERYRDGWEGQQNTWQLGLRAQRGLAFGFPSLLWILFWGLSLRRTCPLSLGLGRNPGILNGGGCVPVAYVAYSELRALLMMPACLPHPTLGFKSGGP